MEIMKKVQRRLNEDEEFMDYVSNIVKILNEYGIKTSRDKIIITNNPGDNYEVYATVGDTYIFIHDLYDADENNIVRFCYHKVILYGDECSNYALKVIKSYLNK